jgi:hypothetical protein
VVQSGVMLLVLLPLLSACAVMPTGPSVMVLPGEGKSFDHFQADDTGCRQYAQTQIGVPPGEAGRSLQRRYDVSYMQCMYAKGHQLPGPRTAPQSGDMPPPPGMPPPPSAGPRPPATVPPPR